MKPSIGITAGDPAGIGLEVASKAIASPEIKNIASFILIGKKRTMPKGVRIGCASRASGEAALSYLDEAIGLLKGKKIDAIVTAPVSKRSLFLAGFKEGGHTEYLAYKTKARRVAMVLLSEKLRVALVTRHVAIREVARLIKKKVIIDTIEVVDEALKRQFKIKTPKIAVASLNPHGGLDAEPQKEEMDEIIPAVKWLNRKGINAMGPFSADALFRRAYRGEYDAVVAMYHDQGLVPLKMASGNRAVNITLGLPFIRTSPDHGTAFDIAGRGVADATSMKEAIVLAVKLVKA